MFESTSYKKFIAITSFTFILFIVIISSFTLRTDAKENISSKGEKYYKSILIEKGDTLWSIAEEYKPEHGVSTKKYVNDLKRMNNINNDIIHEGNYLTIYYYTN